MPAPDFIISLQQRILAGEDISSEELNAAIEQLRTERAEMASSSGGSRKSSPTAPKETSLASFLLNRGITPSETPT